MLKMFATVDVGVDFRVFSRAMLFKTREFKFLYFIMPISTVLYPDRQYQIFKSIVLWQRLSKQRMYFLQIHTQTVEGYEYQRK